MPIAGASVQKYATSWATVSAIAAAEHPIGVRPPPPSFSTTSGSTAAAFSAEPGEAEGFGTTRLDPHTGLRKPGREARSLTAYG